MKITLIDAGKRFNRDWIFRHLNYEFTQEHSYAITGPNGSGKSTLLQAIAGAISISEGSARYGVNVLADSRKAASDASAASPASNPIPAAPPGPVITGAYTREILQDEVYRFISLAAPYLDLTGR
jgi:ABC-type cobalamin/Fe3+-siderophores transport system ATPase subunit